MKQSAYKKFVDNLKGLSKSNLSIRAYEREHHLWRSYFNKIIGRLFSNDSTPLIQKEEVSELWASILSSRKHTKETTVINESCGEGDGDEYSEYEFIRDDSGKIDHYTFRIKIRNKPDLWGKFTRGEMEQIYKMYSFYGDKLTQREVSRFFPEYSLIDFKRILRTFNITKASSPFAPHTLEEKDEETLKEMCFRDKESKVIRSIETDSVRQNEQRIKEQQIELNELRSQVSGLSKLANKFWDQDVTLDQQTYDIGGSKECVLSLYLADLHVGAKVESNSLYKNDYNSRILNLRLDNLIYKVAEFIKCNKVDRVVINLLGDMLDGMDNQTARRDHVMPQNMSNFEQIENYLNSMDKFFLSLLSLIDNDYISVYCISNGNHTEAAEYAANQALLYKLKYKYGVSCTMFTNFFGYYAIGDHTFIITHGKDARFMNKGLPLNLDEKTKVMIYEWLRAHYVPGKYIHFIKGDLHNENINVCQAFDYRNVVSLFGSSDYAMLNFSRSSYGVSYDYINGTGELLRGTFIEL